MAIRTIPGNTPAPKNRNLAGWTKVTEAVIDKENKHKRSTIRRELGVKFSVDIGPYLSLTRIEAIFRNEVVLKVEIDTRRWKEEDETPEAAEQRKIQAIQARRESESGPSVDLSAYTPNWNVNRRLAVQGLASLEEDNKPKGRVAWVFDSRAELPELL